jgi:hypothetical protein
MASRPVSLRSTLRSIPGCTVCAKGSGLRLAFVAPTPSTARVFLDGALGALEQAEVEPKLRLDSLSLSIDLRASTPLKPSRALVALAKHLSRLALSLDLTPRLAKVPGRRRLGASRATVRKHSKEEAELKGEAAAKRESSLPGKGLIPRASNGSLRTEAPW